eukprot:3327715-Rhodomonas_salina.2
MRHHQRLHLLPAVRHDVGHPDVGHPDVSEPAVADVAVRRLLAREVAVRLVADEQAEKEGEDDDHEEHGRDDRVAQAGVALLAEVHAAASEVVLPAVRAARRTLGCEGVRQTLCAPRRTIVEVESVFDARDALRAARLWRVLSRQTELAELRADGRRDLARGAHAALLRAVGRRVGAGRTRLTVCGTERVLEVACRARAALQLQLRGPVPAVHIETLETLRALAVVQICRGR